jgi:hypothetical protein
MVFFLNAPTRPKPWQIAPQRRRVIVLGAGRTGLSAAYHLGEHSLLLEQRGDVDKHADAFRPADLHESGAPHRTERKALFISCSSTGQAHTSAPTLIHIARWEPPALMPPNVGHDTPSQHALLPLLRGEVRFGAQVVRFSPTDHRLELADGSSFIYDKLLCTLSLATVVRLIFRDLPAHVRRDEALRYWLSAHDVEPADRLTQICHGDIDEFAAGKRIAAIISRALSARFHRQGSSYPRDRLFEPRVVRSGMAPAPP